MSRAIEQPLLEYARLEGERAVVRSMERADAAAAFPLIHGRREVLDWLIWQGPDTVTDLEEVYGSWVTPSDDGANYHLAVVDKESGRLAGALGLRFLGHPFVADLGYWLGSDHWGRGLATEAVFLATHLAFRHLASRLVFAEVFLGNVASSRVLEKNRFAQVEGVHLREMPGAPDRPQWRFEMTRQRFERLSAGEAPLAEDVRFAGR